MKKLLVLLTVFALTHSATSAPKAKEKPARKARKPNSAMAAVVDDSALPRVLLIGDSISIAYTVPVRKALEGVANVHRPKANCGPTTTGIAQLDEWLATGGKDKKWDVIHFNWGLHDLKYMGANGGNFADPKAAGSHQQVPPDAYRNNLAQLVKKLKGSGAHLIWRNTTPVPEGARGRVVGDSAAYNEIAAAIMNTHQIETQDLFSFIVNETKKNPSFSRKADVHFPPSTSQAIAEKIAERIKSAL